jgi:hypothetical protein
MGRPPIVPGQRAPRLTPRHREMVRLTVQAGACVRLTPSNFHAAWTVRAGPSGGIEREFNQPTGDWLLHLGPIERTPDSVPVGFRDFSVPFAARSRSASHEIRWDGAVATLPSIHATTCRPAIPPEDNVGAAPDLRLPYRRTGLSGGPVINTHTA